MRQGYTSSLCTQFYVSRVVSIALGGQLLICEPTIVAPCFQWYFKPSPTGPNTYSIVQANTGLILTYPKRPIPGSQLTVEETSDSVWEVRKGHGHWM